jgi:uncharacterized protein DUF3455
MRRFTTETTMSSTASHWLRRSLVVAAVFLAACSNESALGPVRGGGTPGDLEPSQPDVPPVMLAIEAGAGVHHELPPVDAPGCDDITVPSGHTFYFQAYARGVQIYRWSGTTWTLVAPSAVLYADAKGKGRVGTHYAGPTWQSAGGGKVTGAVVERCTADARSIPWLLLRATPDAGPGIFRRTTYIQRLNTVGGNAPAQAGAFVGEQRNVPYTADYLFYRAH